MWNYKKQKIANIWIIGKLSKSNSSIIYYYKQKLWKKEEMYISTFESFYHPKLEEQGFEDTIITSIAYDLSMEYQLYGIPNGCIIHSIYDI